jgi:Bacteriophage head to tail connecting protein
MTEDDIKKMQGKIFSKMLRSNLYQALQEAYTDLGVGTMCLLIQDIDPSKEIHCEAIPSTDLILIKGPYGGVTGIFRPKKYSREELEVLWPDANMAELGAKPLDQNQAAEQMYDVTDGCWRDWADKRDTVYKYGVMANGKLIVKREYRGEGSCPFIVARWSRDATTAWGFGPTYRTLPSIRTLNYVRHLDLKNYDKFVDPPTSYEDDGVMQVDFVEPGTWLPRAVGSKPPEVIESNAKFDLAVFERDELRSTIRRAHYQDRPEQLGKTPPTATQWNDERAERARRMGTPATNLVEELQYPIIRRFMYIMQVRGILPPIQIEGREVVLQPNSSLLRAQEEEEVVRLDKFTELITARFGPQVAMVVINTVKYAERLGELLDIDPKLLRDEAQITAAIEQMLPVLQATKGGVGAAQAPAIAPPGAEAAMAAPPM